MTGVERRLAHQENKAPPLLEHDIRRPAQECRCHPGGDLGHAADRAWGDDHPQRPERAGGDRRRQIADGVNNICPAADHRRLEIGFERQRHLGRPADDEVSLDRQGPQ